MFQGKEAKNKQALHYSAALARQCDNESNMTDVFNYDSYRTNPIVQDKGSYPKRKRRRQAGDGGATSTQQSLDHDANSQEAQDGHQQSQSQDSEDTEYEEMSQASDSEAMDLDDMFQFSEDEKNNNGGADGQPSRVAAQSPQV